MNVKYERCCGIDVHKKSVVACVIVPGADGQPVKETRTFDTLTSDLEGLADWLRECRVTQVVMETTVQGVMLHGDWEFTWEELDPESEAAITAALEWLAWQGWTVTAVMPQDEGRDRTTSSPGGTASG